MFLTLASHYYFIWTVFISDERRAIIAYEKRFPNDLSQVSKTETINQQDEIFRRKRLSIGANFIHVYIEIWDKGILKFNKFSM